MLSVLAEKIHDGRFLQLVRNMLQAGYLEDWIYHTTLSGAPKEVWYPRSSRIFTCTGWTTSSSIR